MEEKDQIIIERYLANELSDAERAEVERRRKEDSFFHQELLDYEMASKALVIRQREELRQRFKDRDKILDAGTKNTNTPHTFRLLWIAVAAIAVISLLLWKFLFSSYHPLAPVYTDGKDSIRANDQQQIVDSLSPPKLQQNEIHTPDQEKKQGQRKVEMADAAKKGGELFAENFEAYKDETLSPVSRGGNDLSPFDKFRKYYWDGKYKEAITTFSALSAEYQKNDNLRFLYAIALASVDRIGEAQSEFKNIMDHHRSIYNQEAHWYMGLLYLKQGDMTNAMIYLQYCVDAPEGYHKHKAVALLKKIK